jgi:hypothetical protein
MTSDKNEPQDSKDPLYDKLSEDIDESDWSMLEAHHERKAVFIVADELDVIEVAIAMAKDNVEDVKTWMADQSLASPTEEQIASWGSDLQQRFIFLIIQPYVLVKRVRKEQ